MTCEFEPRCQIWWICISPAVSNWPIYSPLYSSFSFHVFIQLVNHWTLLVCSDIHIIFDTFDQKNSQKNTEDLERASLPAKYDIISMMNIQVNKTYTYRHVSNVKYFLYSVLQNQYYRTVMLPFLSQIMEQWNWQN